MSELVNHWLYEFVTLLVIMDTITTAPLFMAVTVGSDRKQVRQVAFGTIANTFVIFAFHCHVTLNAILCEA